eukprot:5463281-Pyramimonas_sp.AAC.3
MTSGVQYAPAWRPATSPRRSPTPPDDRSPPEPYPTIPCAPARAPSRRGLPRPRRRRRTARAPRASLAARTCASPGTSPRRSCPAAP